MTTRFSIASRIASSRRYLKRNIVVGKSLSAAYIFYRVARPLLKVRYKWFKWRNPRTPWTSQAAIAIFKELLTADMTVLEYGSGNSTIFFATRVRHLTSVEHDSRWYSTVARELAQLGCKNVDYKLIPPGIDTPLLYSLHQEYGLPENEFSVRRDYTKYFSFARSFPDHHFDMIMVDGRARIECAFNAIPKLKPGGIFVLDNSDRKRYEPIFKVLQGWPRLTTTTGLFDTTFWFKP
jgi:tRNA A58 N-methylase Trm61